VGDDPVKGGVVGCAAPQGVPRSADRAQPRLADRLLPQTNGVIERFFGTLKYEHLFRAPIDDGGGLAMETARFRDIYNRIRPHQAVGDQTPQAAYIDGANRLPPMA
jgi:transposase InsO family protein